MEDKFLRSTLRKGIFGGVVDMLHSSSTHALPLTILTSSHISARNTKMQLSQIMSDRGKQGMHGKVLKRRYQIWMKMKVFIGGSFCVRRGGGGGAPPPPPPPPPPPTRMEEDDKSCPRLPFVQMTWSSMLAVIA